MNKITVKFAGKEYSAYADKVKDSIWVHIEGQTYELPLSEKKGRRRAESEAASGGEIKAPMPGKVTQVLAKVGQVVKKGDTLVVMEAMKMEYNLKASVDGEVEKVEAQVSTQVQLGQVLVAIKEKA